jgi:hypothetical protein
MVLEGPIKYLVQHALPWDGKYADNTHLGFCLQRLRQASNVGILVYDLISFPG